MTYSRTDSQTFAMHLFWITLTAVLLFDAAVVAARANAVRRGRVGGAR